MTTTRLEVMTPAALHRLRVHEHAGLFPPLQGDDRDRLRESMRQRGYDPLHPIVVTPDGWIVDGRNRRDLAHELGLAAPVLRREFASDAEVAAFVVAENLARRHLDQRQRRELAGKLVLNGTSTRAAAEAAGVSRNTAQRAAAEAREAGVPSGTPGEARTNGADGKSYPATRRRAASGQPNRTVLLGAVGDRVTGIGTAQGSAENALERFAAAGPGADPLPLEMREKAAKYAARLRVVVGRGLDLAAALDALAEGRPVEEKVAEPESPVEAPAA